MSIGERLLAMYNEHFQIKWKKARRENPIYSQDNHLVFVYGTLKRGFENHSVLSAQSFKGKTRTKHAWYDMVSMHGVFPAMLSHGEYRVSGELYRVSGDALWTMDIIEGNGTFYQRSKISVEEFDYHDAWCYILIDGNEDGFVSTDHLIWIEEDGPTKTWMLPTDLPYTD